MDESNQQNARHTDCTHNCPALHRHPLNAIAWACDLLLYCSRLLSNIYIAMERVLVNAQWVRVEFVVHREWMDSMCDGHLYGPYIKGGV